MVGKTDIPEKQVVGLINVKPNIARSPGPLLVWFRKLSPYMVPTTTGLRVFATSSHGIQEIWPEARAIRVRSRFPLI